MYKRIISMLLAVSALLAAAVSCGKAQDKSVTVTEIVSANKTLIYDSDGESSDYIELYNSGSSEVSLKGWFLSDKEDKAQKWTFPDVKIKAGQYMTVFCSGKDTYDEKTGELHTNFKLSSSGELVSLISADGVIVFFKQFGESGSDLSFGLVQDGSTEDGSFAWFKKGTPGEKNSGEYSETNDEYLEEIKKEKADKDAAEAAQE